MKLVTGWKVFAVLAVALGILAGCSGGSSSDGLYSATAMPDSAVRSLGLGIAGVTAAASPDEPDAEGRTSIATVRDGLLPGYGGYDVDVLKLHYPYTDPQGATRRVSGLFIAPHEIEKGKVLRAPILLLNHGTTLLRALAPSHLVDDPGAFTKYAEAVFGVVFGRTGYIVALADYAGLGDDPAMHPYMYNASGVNAVLGMLDATKACVAGKIEYCEPLAQKVQWDGRIFIIGYSQGGAVTLGVARELQARGVPVAGVVAMASPSDVSGSMKDKMLERAESKAPLFFPYVVLGLREAYDRRANGSYDSGGLFDPKRNFSGDYAAIVPPLFDGKTGWAEVNSKLPKVPRDMMTPQLIGDLENSQSPIIATLRANNTYDWIPEMKLLLLHHPKDDLVPYANSSVAYKYMKQAKAVYFGDLYVAFDFGSVHAGAAPEAFVRAGLWLDSIQ
jgi:pimeloyl-ACP methyl ester carboxylesterase